MMPQQIHVKGFSYVASKLALLHEPAQSTFTVFCKLVEMRFYQGGSAQPLNNQIG